MQTEGVKYAGSKNKLIPHILAAIAPLDVRTVLDGFAGTTRVSQAFKKAGYAVWANDVAVWSRVFGECYLLNQKPRVHYAPIIEHLNGLPDKNGWFTEHYGGAANDGSSIQADGKKRIWQFHNTRKLDAIRTEIDRIAADKIEKSVLLTSLIRAMDRVDSSLGHQVSYLARWSPRSFQTMRMEVPGFTLDDLPHRVTNRDVFDLPADRVDLAYFDPPYGSANQLMPPSRVRYASYYHLWKTIVLNDQPRLVGAANRRADAADAGADASRFEDFRRGASGRFVVTEAIERLLRETRARYILLSYSNGGRATVAELMEIIENLKFNSRIWTFNYKENVMARMKWTNRWTNETAEKCAEYLFLLSKDDARGLSRVSEL